ncbi:hypothetical protein SNEBB_000794 [Seison nebaliae]|nr:hypothetical protein SNEBB_000794 [Seison nebaliae]
MLRYMYPYNGKVNPPNNIRFDEGVWQFPEDHIISIYLLVYEETIADDQSARMQLDLSLLTGIYFTTKKLSKGSFCDLPSASQPMHVVHEDEDGFHYTSLILAEPGRYYVCIEYADRFNSSNYLWIHQGSAKAVQIEIYEKDKHLMPLPAQIIVLIVLLFLSGLFSGLNLGLLSLDPTELEILTEYGTPSEMANAKKILPLRKRGNFLLCAILIGNVLVNNVLTILLDDLSDGLLAVIISTSFIVIFGEIIPQAICSRHGLMIGAKTIFFTYGFLIITSPVSFPISKILDLILGKEIRSDYSRDKLRAILIHNKDRGIGDILQTEYNIMEGALLLTKTPIGKLMRRIQDIYMIEWNQILNFPTITDIIISGYTRIPIYKNFKQNVVALLNVKDLALIDPEDNLTIENYVDFYQHEMNFSDKDKTLDKMLDDFRTGRYHMAFVTENINEQQIVVGMITLEDIIETIFHLEIADEFDLPKFTDEVSATDHIWKRRRNLFKLNQFIKENDINKPMCPGSLAHASTLFLHKTLPAFSETIFSYPELFLLVQNSFVEFVYQVHHVASSTSKKGINKSAVVPSYPKSGHRLLYKEGEIASHFILLLAGHAEVEIGKNNLKFLATPFQYFGEEIFNLKTERTSENSVKKNRLFIPDFTLRTTTSNLQYLRITQRKYIESLKRNDGRKSWQGDDKSKANRRKSLKKIDSL